MIWIDSQILADPAAIVRLDVVLSGDNALAVGMASFMGMG